MPPRLPNPESRFPARRGYTLTELLIVMVILVILVATALPLVRRVMDGDRVREASRELGAYINMAKTRAVQTGRPCGLLLILSTPLGANPAGVGVPPQYVRQCTQLYMAEVPPLYAGSVLGARAHIRESLNFPTGSNVYEFYPIFLDTSLTPPEYVRDPIELAYLYSLINEGEQFLVRFNHKGPWYICQRGTTATSTEDYFYYSGRTIMDNRFPNPIPPGTAGFVALSSTPLPPGILDTAGNPTPPPSTNPGYYYQIMRSPRPVGDPLELTGGTCIDMTYSGMGVNGQGSYLTNGFASFSGSLALMFTPSGGVTAIYADSSGPQSPTGTIHLLLGRTAKMNDLTSDLDGDGLMNIYDLDSSNLADANSLWVSVGRTNGTVSTSENTPWTNYPGPYTLAGMPNYIETARSIATGRDQMGGQ